MAAFLGDIRIGHSIRTRAVFPNRVVTTHISIMTLRRNGREIRCQSHYQYIETSDGQPVSFHAFERTNDEVTRRVIGHITSGQLNARRMIRGEWEARTFPWPTDAMLPEGARLLRRRMGIEAGTTYNMTTFDVRQLVTAVNRVTVGPHESVELLGAVAELTRLEVARLRDSRNVTVEYVDVNLNTLKSVAPMLGTHLSYVACDKAVALRPLGPLEQAGLGSIPSPVRLSDEQRTMTLTYRLRVNGDERLELPTDNTQTVASDLDGQLDVTVSRAAAPPAAAIPYCGDDPAVLAALQTDTHLQPDNIRLAELAHSAIGDATDARLAARLLERYVFGYINRGNHHSGYGTALDVLQSREGDCTEHAVLLASMCRAVGLPAQVVSGVAYKSGPNGTGMFSTHAWVRVLVGDQWLHLDSTRRRVDAGYIMLAVGSGRAEGFPTWLDKFGSFDIVAIRGNGELLSPSEIADSRIEDAVMSAMTVE